IRQGAGVNVEAQMNGARYLVDVLAAGALRADAAQLDFPQRNRQRTADRQHFLRVHCASRAICALRHRCSTPMARWEPRCAFRYTCALAFAQRAPAHPQETRMNLEAMNAEFANQEPQAIIAHALSLPGKA